MTGHLPPDAISLSDLARRLGVSKQAVHRRVTTLVASGDITTWQGPRRTVMVSTAAYDFAVAKTGDPARELSAHTMAMPAVTPLPSSAEGQGEIEINPAYRDARARDAYYAAELKRLTLEREQGRHYPVADVTIALQRIGEAIREATRLAPRADEASDVLEAGMPAFRRWLTRLGDDICRRVASELRVTAAEVEAATHAVPDAGMDPGDPDFAPLEDAAARA